MMSKRYVYYMLRRPPVPGAMPIDGLADLKDFGERMYVREIDREAWGKLIYMRKLSDEEVDRWELAPGREYEEYEM